MTTMKTWTNSLGMMHLEILLAQAYYYYYSIHHRHCPGFENWSNVSYFV